MTQLGSFSCSRQEAFLFFTWDSRDSRNFETHRHAQKAPNQQDTPLSACAPQWGSFPSTFCYGFPWAWLRAVTDAADEHCWHTDRAAPLGGTQRRHRVRGLSSSPSAGLRCGCFKKGSCLRENVWYARLLSVLPRMTEMWASSCLPIILTMSCRNQHITGLFGLTSSERQLASNICALIK